MKKNNFVLYELWLDAQRLQDSGQFYEAEKRYTLLIDIEPRWEFFSARCLSYRFQKKFLQALDDINKCLELNPMDGCLYWMKSALLTNWVCEDHTLSLEKKDQYMAESEMSIQQCKRLVPESEVFWAECIEKFLISENYCAALGAFGESRPFVKSDDYKLIREYLGLVGASLIGRDIGNLTYMNSSHRISGKIWCTTEIESLLLSKTKREGLTPNIIAAIKVHQLFISKIDNLILYSKEYHDFISDLNIDNGGAGGTN
ncbi:MAG TPA: hypothetical protein PKW80_00690 [Bacteroidales bacterium]|nr:hypothetical protein [Bacteroidales bacterium]